MEALLREKGREKLRTQVKLVYCILINSITFTYIYRIVRINLLSKTFNLSRKYNPNQINKPN